METLEQKMARLREGIGAREAKRKAQAETMRQEIAAADPTLLAFLDAMRDGFGARLTWLKIDNREWGNASA